MSRLRINVVLSLLTLCGVVGKSPPGVRISADWDVSPADRADYFPNNHFIWSRFDDSPFVTRTIKARQRRPSVPKKFGAVATDDLDDAPAPAGFEVSRVRRDTDPESKMEQIAATKNVREARMGSPETWAKQPLSVQFRNRPNLEQVMPDNYDDTVDSDEAANLPPLIRAHYAPKTDFVTSGRGRGSAEGRHLLHPEGRESRDMPIARSYDEYEVPIFRNVVREHDFDVQIPRNYYYPNRYRSQRDYYYRGAAGANPYLYDRYRDEEEDYEVYGRYRPTPKPKRIIYYATLPEVVRKPVDLRNYPRPYDPLVRGPEAQIEAERNRISPNNVEPSRRPLRYPYDNYDNYVKRSSYYDRRRPPYAAVENDRARDQERIRGGYKEKMRSDDRQLEGQKARSADDRRLPWPVQIGTEINVKDSERIPGRKIFGQIEGYDRYDGSRMKKTQANAERKEDTNDNNDSNNENNH